MHKAPYRQKKKEQVPALRSIQSKLWHMETAEELEGNGSQYKQRKTKRWYTNTNRLCFGREWGLRGCTKDFTGQMGFEDASMQGLQKEGLFKRQQRRKLPKDLWVAEDGGTHGRKVTTCQAKHFGIDSVITLPCVLAKDYGILAKHRQ